ncbi:MAG: helix-turn-helix transcriptional regulator [Sneathiella sp.]|nr:helix-turn-helix transcriptional regulator [Sneathiella sp.]
MTQKLTITPYSPSDFLERPTALRVNDLSEGADIVRHQHLWGQLAYTVTGVVLVATEDGRWLVPPGRAVWIPAEKAHSIHVASAAKFFIIHIARDKTLTMPRECCVLTVSPLLRELMANAESISRDYHTDSPQSRLMDVILDQICLAEKAPLHLPMPSDERLLKLVEIFMQNPADGRTLSELAHEIGASGRNLSRLFKQETGITFGKWRQQRRLMAAIELLAAGRPVTAVALDMGYDSISAFISMFKQILGVTPSRYFDGVKT